MKKYLLLFVTILCCGFLVGCNSDENSKKDDIDNESNGSGAVISVSNYSTAIQKDWLVSKFRYFDKNDKLIVEDDLSFYRSCDLDLYSFKDNKVFTEVHSFDCSEVYNHILDYKVRDENLFFYQRHSDDEIKPLDIISLTKRELILKKDITTKFVIGPKDYLPEGTVTQQIVFIAK